MEHIIILDGKLKFVGDFYFIQHYSTIIFFITSLIITIIMLLLSYIFSITLIKDNEQLSEYECGFEPFDNATRSPFDIHFYIIGILFLIFDVEIALLFPWIWTLSSHNNFAFFIGFFFIIILSIGYLYEWKTGILNWSNKKNLITNTEQNQLLYMSVMTIAIPRNELTNWYTLDITINEILFSIIVFLNIVLIMSKFFKEKANNLATKIQLIPVIMDISILTLLLYLGLELLKYTEIKSFIICVNQELHYNNYTDFIKVLLILCSITIFLISKHFLKFNITTLHEYSLLLIFALLFLLILTITYSLISTIMAIIGVSLILYTLIGIDKKNQRSREATIKYFLLSALSSGLFIYSMVFCLTLYKTTFFHSINIISLNFLIDFNNHLVLDLIFISNLFVIGFLLIAFFFKLGCFPSHMWTVEIYQGSSNPVMSFFILPMKLVLFSVFTNLMLWVFNNLQWFWSILVWIASIMSLIWGCLGAIFEQDFKKFISFSSINQIGFLLFGISCIYFEAIASSIIYLTIYVITNIVLFIIINSTIKCLSNSRIVHINELNIFSINYFLLSIFLSIILLSFAGIPPLAGFFGKFFLFIYAFEFNFLILLMFGILTSIVSTFYYLNLINKMFFSKYTYTTHFYNELNPLLHLFLFGGISFIILHIMYFDIEQNVIEFVFQ